MNRNGFTLVEILLTIAFLFVGLLAILQIFPAAFGMERTSQMKSQAALLAQEKIEAISAKSYQEVAVGDVVESSLASPFQLFSRRTKVDYVGANLQATTSDAGLKKVEITVSWKTSLPLASKEFKAVTLIAAK